MTDAVTLPDGTLLLLNGVRNGCGGGFQGVTPVLQPLLYTPSAPRGSRFTKMPKTNIPRMYHSVATLLPSGEVLVAGSNPFVGYTPYGNVSLNQIYPKFWNYDGVSYLHQQQLPGFNHPTEYRVEIFSPPYMNEANTRPAITTAPAEALYGRTFVVKATNWQAGKVVVKMSYSGFHTHAQDMGQRMINLATKEVNGQLVVTAPENATIMPPGVYLLWVVNNGVPSVAKWIKLQH